MNIKTKMYLSVFWVLLGIALFALSFGEVVDNFWSGMGGGLIAVGVLQLIRFRRVQKDPEYRENMEVEASDERNQFLAGKAWQLAGTLFIITVGISVIVLRLLEQVLLSMAASYVLCYLLVLYWIAWLVLRKKY